MEPEKFNAGPLTMAAVFKANGLTNLSDMQAVLDAVEAALRARDQSDWIGQLLKPEPLPMSTPCDYDGQLMLGVKASGQGYGFIIGKRHHRRDDWITDEWNGRSAHCLGWWAMPNPIDPKPSGVDTIPDEELLRRAVLGLRVKPSGRGRRVPLWSAVMARFQLGSTYAWQLCQRFGMDADEEVKP